MKADALRVSPINDPVQIKQHSPKGNTPPSLSEHSGHNSDDTEVDQDELDEDFGCPARHLRFASSKLDLNFCLKLPGEQPPGKEQQRIDATLESDLATDDDEDSKSVCSIASHATNTTTRTTATGASVGKISLNPRMGGGRQRRRPTLDEGRFVGSNAPGINPNTTWTTSAMPLNGSIPTLANRRGSSRSPVLSATALPNPTIKISSKIRNLISHLFPSDPSIASQIQSLSDSPRYRDMLTEILEKEGAVETKRKRLSELVKLSEGPVVGEHDEGERRPREHTRTAGSWKTASMEGSEGVFHIDDTLMPIARPGPVVDEEKTLIGRSQPSSALEDGRMAALAALTSQSPSNARANPLPMISTERNKSAPRPHVTSVTGNASAEGRSFFSQISPIAPTHSSSLQTSCATIGGNVHSTHTTSSVASNRPRGRSSSAGRMSDNDSFVSFEYDTNDIGVDELLNSVRGGSTVMSVGTGSALVAPTLPGKYGSTGKVVPVERLEKKDEAPSILASDIPPSSTEDSHIKATEAQKRGSFPQASTVSSDTTDDDHSLIMKHFAGAAPDSKAATGTISRVASRQRLSSTDADPKIENSGDGGEALAGIRENQRCGPGWEPGTSEQEAGQVSQPAIGEVKVPYSRRATPEDCQAKDQGQRPRSPAEPSLPSDTQAITGQRPDSAAVALETCNDEGDLPTAVQASNKSLLEPSLADPGSSDGPSPVDSCRLMLPGASQVSFRSHSIDQGTPPGTTVANSTSEVASAVHGPEVSPCGRPRTQSHRSFSRELAVTADILQPAPTLASSYMCKPTLLGPIRREITLPGPPRQPPGAPSQLSEGLRTSLRAQNEHHRRQLSRSSYFLEPSASSETDAAEVMPALRFSMYFSNHGDDDERCLENLNSAEWSEMKAKLSETPIVPAFRDRCGEDARPAKRNDKDIAKLKGLHRSSTTGSVVSLATTNKLRVGGATLKRHSTVDSRKSDHTPESLWTSSFRGPLELYEKTKSKGVFIDVLMGETNVGDAISSSSSSISLSSSARGNDPDPVAIDIPSAGPVESTKLPSSAAPVYQEKGRCDVNGRGPSSETFIADYTRAIKHYEDPSLQENEMHDSSRLVISTQSLIRRSSTRPSAENAATVSVVPSVSLSRSCSQSSTASELTSKRGTFSAASMAVFRVLNVVLLLVTVGLGVMMILTTFSVAFVGSFFASAVVWVLLFGWYLRKRRTGALKGAGEFCFCGLI